MDKSAKFPYKIVEKTPLKNKLLMKAILPQTSQLMVTRFSHEDTMAACGYSNGRVRVFNLSTDNKISEIDTAGKETGPVNSLRWRPSEENSSMSSVLLVANTNGNLYQFAAKTGKELFHTFEEGNYIMAVDYAPDGRRFATAGKDNIIRIYDEETKKIGIQLSGVKWHSSGHNNRVFSLKFSPDNPDLLVSGGWDMNVNVWDVRTNNVISTIYGPKISGDSLDIRGNLLLTGANRGKEQLQLWDWKENKLMHTFAWDDQQPQNNGFIYCAQFCNQVKHAVMAVGGSDLKIFNVDNFSQILEINFDKQNAMYTCDSGHTGNKYLAGGKHGALFYFGSNKNLE